MLRKNIKKIMALLLTFCLLLGMLGSGIVMADDSITLDGNDATAEIGEVKSDFTGVDIKTLYDSETNYDNSVQVNRLEPEGANSIKQQNLESLTANIESIDVKNNTNNTDSGTTGISINNNYTTVNAAVSEDIDINANYNIQTDEPEPPDEQVSVPSALGVDIHSQGESTSQIEGQNVAVTATNSSGSTDAIGVNVEQEAKKIETTTDGTTTTTCTTGGNASAEVKDITVKSSGTATGLNASDQGGTATARANNVTVKAEKDAKGITASSVATWDKKLPESVTLPEEGQPENQEIPKNPAFRDYNIITEVSSTTGETNINAKDVTVESSKEKAYGIDAKAVGGTTAVTAGNVLVNTGGDASGVRVGAALVPDITRIYDKSNTDTYDEIIARIAGKASINVANLRVKGFLVTGIAINNDNFDNNLIFTNMNATAGTGIVDVIAKDINVECFQGTGIEASSTYVVDICSENLLSQVESDQTFAQSGKTNINVGNITVTAKLGAAGIDAESIGSNTTVNAKDVNVKASEAASSAKGIIALSNAGYTTDHRNGEYTNMTLAQPGKTVVEVGAVTVEGKNEDGMYEVIGIDARSKGSTTTVIAGDVTAESDRAIGIHATVNSGYDTKATFEGGKTETETLSPLGVGEVSVYANDVTAKGDGSVAIYVQGDDITKHKDAASKVNIIADGTVSAEDVAIKVLEESPGQEEYETVTKKYDTDNINLTVWSVNANKDNEIIRVIKTEAADNMTKETVDQAVSRAMEKGINYIIKAADGVMPRIAVTTAKGKTVVIGDTTYHTANEDEAVTLNITLAEDEVLEGIYYNNDDTSSLLTVDSLVKNSQGGYVMNMLRGGGMLVGLKIHKHTPGAAVVENPVSATCTSEGSYDSVVYCSECGAELSRSRVVTPMLNHIPGEPAMENITATGYDVVTRCTLCGAVLSMHHVESQPVEPVIPELPVEPVVPELPVEPVIPEPDYTNEPSYTLQYAPVDPSTMVNGVKAGDHLPLGETVSIVGKYLDDENAELIIKNVDHFLTEEEMERFNLLSAKDKFMVLLILLGFEDEIEEYMDEMSQEAKALAADITARIDSMSEAEREDLQDNIRELFQTPSVVIDGETCESLILEFEIITGEQHEYYRYTFYENDASWQLYMIEKGGYTM